MDWRPGYGLSLQRGEEISIDLEGGVHDHNLKRRSDLPTGERMLSEPFVSSILAPHSAIWSGAAITRQREIAEGAGSINKTRDENEGPGVMGGSTELIPS
jgi:hypothetical protein